MFKCQLCEKKAEFKTIQSLLSHIQHNHKGYNSERYYRTFIMKRGEGLCRTCGKPTKFMGLVRGYQRYCGNKCVWRDPAVKEKRAKTNSAKTDSEVKMWHEKICETKRLKNDGSYLSAEETQKRRLQSEAHFRKYFTKCDCEFLGYDEKVHFRCNRCGREDSFVRGLIDRMDRNGDYGICHFCNDRHCVSAPERELKTFISSFYDKTIICGDRKLLNGKELDLLFPDIKLAIEFDGLHWHNDAVVDMNYHISKTNACETRGYQLIHIFENEWNEKRDIVKSRIRSLFGMNERIFARKCECEELECAECGKFLENNHLRGNCDSEYRYGLFYGDELSAVMTFGKSSCEDECVLLRFASKMNCNVIGGAGKLFTRFQNAHPEINKIVTFVDRRWSGGNLFEKLNFSRVSDTAISCYHIVNRKLYDNAAFQNMANAENMKKCGVSRIYDCGRIKYEWLRNNTHFDEMSSKGI